MTADRYARDASHGGPDDVGPDALNDNSLGGDRVPQDGPIAERVEHNPGNLGDEVKDAGDQVYPAPTAGSGEELGSSEM